VFTHDISFYYELSCEAAAEGVPLAKVWIDYVRGKGFGVISPDDSPWAMKSVKDRLTWLEKQLEQMPDAAACGKDAYEQVVTGFYTRLPALILRDGAAKGLELAANSSASLRKRLQVDGFRPPRTFSCIR